MSTHTFTINRHNLLQTDLIIGFDSPDPYTIRQRFTLLDTGAAICHMTYALWKLLKFDSVLQKEIDEKYPGRFQKKVLELSFDELPLRKKYSNLGDNSEVKVYEFRLDYIILGEIKLHEITVRLINSGKREEFIVGWNVLKYLDFKAVQNKDSINCFLSLRPYQRQIFENDKLSRLSNYMPSRFSYIPLN